MGGDAGAQFPQIIENEITQSVGISLRAGIESQMRIYPLDVAIRSGFFGHTVIVPEARTLGHRWFPSSKISAIGSVPNILLGDNAVTDLWREVEIEEQKWHGNQPISTLQEPTQPGSPTPTFNTQSKPSSRLARDSPTKSQSFIRTLTISSANSAFTGRNQRSYSQPKNWHSNIGMLWLPKYSMRLTSTLAPHMRPPFSRRKDVACHQIEI